MRRLNRDRGGEESNMSFNPAAPRMQAERRTSLRRVAGVDCCDSRIIRVACRRGVRRVGMRQTFPHAHPPKRRESMPPFTETRRKGAQSSSDRPFLPRLVRAKRIFHNRGIADVLRSVMPPG